MKIVKNNKISESQHVIYAFLQQLLVDGFSSLMQELSAVEIDTVLLKVLILQPGQNQLILTLLMPQF